MNSSVKPPFASGGGGGATRRIARTALAVGLLTGGLAAGAQAADAHSAAQTQHLASRASAQVRQRTLTVAGTAASDTLALRLRPGDAEQLEVDVGDDGSADFTMFKAGSYRLRPSRSWLETQ